MELEDLMKINLSEGEITFKSKCHHCEAGWVKVDKITMRCPYCKGNKQHKIIRDIPLKDLILLIERYKMENAKEFNEDLRQLFKLMEK